MSLSWVGVDGPPAPAPRVPGQLVLPYFYSPADRARARGPAGRHIVALGDFCVHVLGFSPGTFWYLALRPPHCLVALDRDREVSAVRQRRPGNVGGKETRVCPQDRAPEPLWQGGHGAGDELWCLRAGVGPARAELGRQHPARFCPHRGWGL